MAATETRCSLEFSCLATVTAGAGVRDGHASLDGREDSSTDVLRCGGKNKNGSQQRVLAIRSVPVSFL